MLVVVAIRQYRALSATFSLLSDWRLLRTLPWRYIVKLPLHHGWIAVAGCSLLIAVACALLALALPSSDASNLAVGLGWVAAVIGLVSSWVRAGLGWLRLRGR